MACGGATPRREQLRPQRTQGCETSVEDGVYVLNKVKPKVTWSAQKLTGDGHNGTLHIESGKFRVTWWTNCRRHGHF